MAHAFFHTLLANMQLSPHALDCIPFDMLLFHRISPCFYNQYLESSLVFKDSLEREHNFFCTLSHHRKASFFVCTNISLGFFEVELCMAHNHGCRKFSGHWGRNVSAELRICKAGMIEA